MHSVAFSPDGGVVATGDHNAKLTLWSASTGEKLREAQCGASCAAWRSRPDGRVVAAAT